ncbi:MAG: hypothetical protein WBN92_20240, partial [Terriglobia bacterium]
MAVSLEVVRFGSRDPLASPRIAGFCDRQRKTRDPKKRDHGYQSLWGYKSRHLLKTKSSKEGSDEPLPID